MYSLLTLDQGFSWSYQGKRWGPTGIIAKLDEIRDSEFEC